MSDDRREEEDLPQADDAPNDEDHTKRDDEARAEDAELEHPESEEDSEETIEDERDEDRDETDAESSWRERASRYIVPALLLALGVLIGWSFSSAGDGAGTDAGGGRAPAAGAGAEVDEDIVWTCSMHPQIQQDEPGQCPICGMDLIPNSEVGGGGGPELTDTQVQLSERARTLGRVRTTAVRRLEEPRATIHLLGRLEVAETRQHTVTAWTGGRIDRLRVESTGAKLRRGQVIATLYSPEIYAAHRDLITASQQLDSLSGGEAFARRSAISNIRSTRRRLELLGVPERVIDRMAEAERPWTDIDIRTPFGGTVTERLVREGEYVQPGTGLYRVADLSKLWVQLDAYETDLQLVDVGAPVELTVASVPDRVFEGRVAFIDPTVDTKTRTVSLRVELDNPDGALRPGMFAEARLSGSIDPAHDRTLVIPESAPLFSGRRSLVYVELPGRDRPTYEAREVRLGDKVEDMYPVIAGLREGERVVSHGAFILDADLQIRGGKSLMMRDVDARDPLDEVLSPSPQLRAALAPVLRAYLDVQEALAADDLAAAREATTSLEETAREVEADGADRRVADAWLELRAELISYATSIRKSGDIAGARRAFEGLSETIKRLLHRFGNPLDEPLRLAYCPMAFDNAGAEWIQRAPEIDNAYFGAEMRRCGEIRQTVDTGGHIVPPGATSEAAESGAATHDHNHTHDHGGTP